MCVCVCVCVCVREREREREDKVLEGSEDSEKMGAKICKITVTEI